MKEAQVPILAGDSKEQREAEKWLIGALSKKLGVKLAKNRWALPSGTSIELDGFCESPVVLCETWAHVGRPKSAQKQKVMTDALKLLFVKRLLKGKGRLILLFADHDAAACFQANSWMADCLNELGVEVETIELPSELRSEVVKAQQRQYR